MSQGRFGQDGGLNGLLFCINDLLTLDILCLVGLQSLNSTEALRIRFHL